MDWRDAYQFSQDFWWGLGWGGHLYWRFMRLGFLIQNVGEMGLPSPVARYDRHVDLSKIWHLLNSVSYTPCILLLIKYSILCVSLWHWGFRFGSFSSITIFFLQSNLRVLVIHEL